MKIDADFSGGNIIVDAVEGESVRLRQDWSTSSQWWFYWCFRVRGAEGRSLRFHFEDGDVLSAGGACVSGDGIEWRWLGRATEDNTFDYLFAPHEHEVFFAFCPLYTQRHLAQFLEREPGVQCETLCRVENGYELEQLWLESKAGRYLVPFLARTHACETMASFVLEGIFQFWLHDPEGGAWLRSWVDFRAVPLMDKSGVENGEQGKFRIPHDHNRDWTEQPHFAATRAVMQTALSWRGEMALFLDLHCPWIRGGRNSELFFVGIEAPQSEELERFSSLLERSQRGGLRYSVASNIAFGVAWNQGGGHNARRYFQQNFPVRFASTLEVPYALAGGEMMTPQRARAFGHDVARAIALYLQRIDEGGNRLE